MPDEDQQLSSAYPAIAPPVSVRLTVFPEDDCSYLPGRRSITRALYADRLDPELYHAFMDAGFRRSGKIIYQPVCHGCRACVQLRVPVKDFVPSKSHRRVMRRNSDLQVQIDRPQATDEKYELYRRYLEQWHDRAEVHTRDEYEDFLYRSPVETLEFSYRTVAGELLAVGICDVSSQALSSVYFYFDPAHASRGLGTFGALYEIDFAQRSAIPFYYLGYWIDRCMSMQYKSNFRPHQLLGSDGIWRTLEASGGN